MATEQPAKAPVTTEIEPAGPNKTDEKPSTPEVEYDSRRSKFLLAIDRADVIEIAEQLCLGVNVDCVQTLSGNRYATLHLVYRVCMHTNIFDGAICATSSCHFPL